MTRGQGVDLDAILGELGEFGRHQRHTFYLILLPIALSGCYNSQYIFAAGDVGYRCAVPQCESPPLQYEAGAWGAWALPGAGRCARYAPAGSTCDPDSFLPNQTQRCDAWVYASNLTIVAEFELACQEWRRTLVGTVHSAGVFTALCYTGLVSDTFGRRTAFILTASTRSLAGVARAFSTSYVMYICLEFLDATLGSGVYTTGFILALEMMGRNRRVLGGNILAGVFALGQVLLAALAWTIPYWRTRTLVLYGPSILFLFYYFCLDESVRWLLSKGKTREAARILLEAARVNKRTLSPESIRQLNDSTHQQGGSKSVLSDPDVVPQSLFSQVIRSRIIMSRLLICSFWWVSVIFIYYGLSINSVSLAGNQYVNYMLTSIVEIPGYAMSVLTLDRFGRKSSIMSAFFCCGTALLAMPYIPDSHPGVKQALTLWSKMCASMAIGSIYVYSAELQPTAVRHRLLALLSMAGRIGQIAAPQIPLLTMYMESLPYLIFGGMALTSCALMLLTPETLRMRLPDTVAQAEGLAAAPRTTRRTDIIND